MKTPSQPVQRKPIGILAQFESSLEWEMLGTEIIDVDVQRINGESVDGLRAKISRDLEYKLQASLYGTMSNDKFDSLVNRGAQIPGTSIPRARIECTYNQYADVVLHDVALGSHTRTYLPTRLHLTDAQIELYVPSVTLSIQANPIDKDTAFLTDWFLSGPREGSQIWTRLSKRTCIEQYTRERVSRGDTHAIPIIKRPSMPRVTSDSGAWDHISLQYAENQRVIVAEVGKSFIPQWSAGIGLEFHHNQGGFPDPKMREAVAEGLGFLFGRQFLKVGTSAFDAMGQPLFEEVISPWGRDVAATCQAHDEPPIRTRRQDSESILSKLLQAYIRQRDTLALKDAVWTIWIARRMPVGFDLPLYATAMERLMGAWYQSTRSKSKGVYMSAPEFRKVTQQGIETIRNQLGQHEYADRIVRRLSGCNNFGVAEKFDNFFDELQLTISKAERDAIQSRNRIAHGGGPGESAWDDYISKGKTYRTLLNRTILKLLAYEGNYIDYGTVGFPDRSLPEASTP